MRTRASLTKLFAMAVMVGTVATGAAVATTSFIHIHRVEAMSGQSAIETTLAPSSLATTDFIHIH